ncbi:hypothetical protein V2J09_002853 [Rumex salicifolius]
MKTLTKIIFLFTFLVSSTAINGSSAASKSHDQYVDRRHVGDKEETSFLNYWKDKNVRPNAGRMTCDRYPRVCHVRGSAGPDCCKKKCVDVKSDRLNCGMCGNKCRYSEARASILYVTGNTVGVAGISADVEASIIFLFTFLVSSTAINGSSAASKSHDVDRRHVDDKEETSFLNYWKDKNVRPNAGRMTCDRYPRVCHVRGSAGPDCCKKKCVDVKSDRLNCGMCGNKCRYPEVCCKGTCVNPLRDRKHCGSCGNKCRRGSFCDYGMCSYA